MQARHASRVVEQEPMLRIATRAESEQVADALLLAFSRDPVARWALPDPTLYRVGFTAFALAFGGVALDCGTAFVSDDFGGAALWLPPGEAPDEAAVAAAFERSAPPERLAALFELMEKMGGHHPDEPHWYLPLMGVDPAQQGRGLGAALLRHALACVDREGMPAYLESTNPANLSLYRRHGFEVIAELRAGDSPLVFPMLREPR